MKQKVVDGKLKVEVEIKGDEWKEAIIKAENELVKNFELKGFRKGSVPKDQALKHIKRSRVWETGVKNLIKSSKTLKKTFDDVFKKETVLSQPSLEIVAVTDSELKLNLVFLIMPEVKLGNYRTLKTKRDLIKINQEVFKRELDKFLDHIKEFDKITKGKTTKGDNIIIDFDGYVDNKQFPGGKADDYELKLGSNTFIPGFEDQLIGKNVGDKLEVKVNFPKDYHSKDVAGKPAIFKVKIKTIKKEKILDEKTFNKKLQKFGFKDLQQVKENLKTLMERDAKDKANAEFKTKIIREILKMKETSFNVPEELIEAEVNQQIEALKQQLGKQKMSLKDYLKRVNKTNEDIKKEFWPTSLERIQTALIINKIAKENKLELTPEEEEAEIVKQASQQRMDVATFKQMANIDAIKTNLLYEKVLDFLSK